MYLILFIISFILGLILGIRLLYIFLYNKKITAEIVAILFTLSLVFYVISGVFITLHALL